MTLKVGILFGGQSQEHEISIISALSVMRALDRSKYDIYPIAIDKEGRWHQLNFQRLLSIKEKNLSDRSLEAIRPKRAFSLMKTLQNEVDVIFPLLHGPQGEDGTLQGMLKLLNVPFVGCGHLAAGVAMDKDIAKRLLTSWNIPTASFRTLTRPEDYSFETLTSELGLPFFLKAVHLGSSVGVFCVHNKEEYQMALKEAFSYDTKVIVEERIVGRELECAVLGNLEPKASLVGEILLPPGEHYDYNLKYIESHRVNFALPAELTPEQMESVRGMALKAYRAIGAEGMARIDFFLRDNGEILVNEINPIPGFTQISLFPKLWEISGLSYASLLDQLIQLAIERHRRHGRLKSVVDPSQFICA